MSYGVVFCGTPEFAIPSLEALIQDPDFVVQRVFSQPDQPSGRGQKPQPSPIKSWALKQNLEVKTPQRISTTGIISEIKQKKWDLAIVVAFGQILTKEFLDAFPMGCFNIHSSVLPRWRGAAPMQRAIMAGDSQTGVSLQRVALELDAGDLIGSRKVELPIEMGASELYKKLSHLGAELLTCELKRFLGSGTGATSQDETQVCYAPKISKQEARVDWHKSAFEIHNKIRGLNRGGPYAFTNYKQKTLKLHQSRWLKREHGTSAGEIIELKSQCLVVACGQDAVELLVLQPAGKAKIKAADFIHGYRPKKGDFFE